MGWFAFTPAAWELGGRQSGSYPEIVFMGFGLPLALLAIVCGGLLPLLVKPRSRSGLEARIVAAIGAAAVALCALLAASAVVP